MDIERTKRSASGRLRVAAIALSSVAAVALLASMTATQATNSTPITPIVATPWPGYADLIEQIMPTVVTITATRTAAAQVDESPGEGSTEGFQRHFGGPEGSDEMERFMERFFPQRPMPFEGPHSFGPGAATGSGFIVGADGLVVTNNHVIDGAETVTVTLHDGRDFAAKILGTDRDTDLALLRIDAGEPLPTATFADPKTVRVGDPVIAIGNPFGLGGTVTAGIVSADHRSIGIGRYDDFLQIDAPINRGNSGGPTFNLKGEVIGINTLINSPSGGNVGIGFAIPADLAQGVIAELAENGQVERGWLGVHIQGLDDDLAMSLGLEDAAGALVAQVSADSPAAAAGLERGDVIVGFAGEPITQLVDLTRKVADTDPGAAVEVDIWRDGAAQTLSVEIGRMPGEDAVVASADAALEGSDTPKLGMTLARLTEEARQSLDLPAAAGGVVVTGIQQGGAAASKGLRRGDVIIEADHQGVSEPEMVVQAIRAATERGEDAILLLIKRDGQDRFVAVPIERA